MARKGDSWYAVIYEGLDPVTGKERRLWHPAGSSREDAELLAGSLAAELNGCNDEVRALTFRAYLTERWLAGKRLALAASTWDGYRRKIVGRVADQTLVGRSPVAAARSRRRARCWCLGMIVPRNESVVSSGRDPARNRMRLGRSKQDDEGHNGRSP
jgi:hypothetical protein